MKQIFDIEGMTCGGCVQGVKQKITVLPNVSNVNVSLENGTIALESPNLINTEDIKAVLPEKYKVYNSKNSGKKKEAFLVAEKTKLQQLRPLLLILSYISIASFWIHFKEMNTTEIMLTFMGLFYIVFSFFKFLDVKGFVSSFRMYDPLAKQFSFYAWIYPFIETALGLLFLTRTEIKIGLIITLLILGITTIGVTKTLVNKQKIQCACLGTALKLPMTEATFIENAIMIIMSIIMLLIGVN
ncbi:heavy-metal-associated domain-containing protein [Aquimarina agarilytica]|uniref:heavy-metal-associated domain-containing protein n=1 Tax=Aquimarina agarilytica TaxID=1087449 RepID=UPI000288DF0F|nr:heavy-metal-associated domain-containing protein [Aquimarina agarilytica]